jgi:hypothetical protein
MGRKGGNMKDEEGREGGREGGRERGRKEYLASQWRRIPPADHGL